MGVLDREAIYISFLEQLKNADQRILLLDYDGTMAPFHKDRTHAFPYPEIPPLLTEIMKAGTRRVAGNGTSVARVGHVEWALSTSGDLGKPRIRAPYAQRRLQRGYTSRKGGSCLAEVGGCGAGVGL